MTTPRSLSPCPTRHRLLALLLSAALCSATAQKPADPHSAPSPHIPATPAGFDGAADAALAAMQRRAAELNIQGVAVVAFFEDEKIQGWSSKMLVVGHLKDEPAPPAKGSNLLGIAYAKAAEMADTLKDSGSQVRPPLTGEFGWSGGVIVHGRSGYLIAAFSGGKSEDDVQVSRAGVEQLKSKL